MNIIRSLNLGFYRHFKGEVYEVLDLAQHSETQEDMVVYYNLVEKKTWVRPLKSFLSKVLIDGAVVDRFTFIDKKDQAPYYERTQEILKKAEKALGDSSKLSQFIDMGPDNGFIEGGRAHKLQGVAFEVVSTQNPVYHDILKESPLYRMEFFK